MIIIPSNVSADPFTTLSSSFLLWLDAATYTTSDQVTWTAKKGPNAILTSPHTTTTPQTVNGFPCIFLNDGAFTISNFTAPSNLAVFVVGSDTIGYPLLIEQSTNANSIPGFYFYSNSGYPYNYYRYSTGYARWNTSSDWWPTDTSGAISLGSFNFNGSTFTLTKNKSVVSTTFEGTVASNSNATETLYIGSRANEGLLAYGFRIFEIIISPGLSSSDYALVNNYLTKKYSIT